MLKKLHGRIRRSKWLGVSQETEQDVKLLEQVKSVKVTVKNSTTSDTTVKVVSIMCLLVLSAVMQTGLDNPRDRK